MNQAYSESDDFREHQQHIEDMYAALGPVGIPTDSRVLDVGGGLGMHACFLAQRYSSCYCLDIIEYQSLYGGEYYRLFREKCARNGVIFEDSQLTFIQCDAMDLLFRDGFFDFVTSFNALEHIPDPRRAIDEMVRVTRQGGIIYLTFDPIWTADTGSHFFHRVSEPWAHLVDSQDAFVKRMRDAGASEDEVSDFRGGMNQLRLSRYRDIFRQVAARSDIELLHESSWSGMADPAFAKHPNYRKCTELGYDNEELRFRGMRYILRKM